jgi:hypothetical protein
MDIWSRLRRLFFRLVRWSVVLVGFWVLYHYSLAAFGGRDKLWAYEKQEHHRFQSMAMLTGTLRLANGLAKLGHDEEVYNGATYTNWGYGVAALQVPFHVAAGKMKSLPTKFFPDRAIYFGYLMATVALLWAAFDRLLSMREPFGASKLRRHFLSWAATAFVLVTVFFPFMASRWHVYEETCCYLALAEMAALAAYVFALRAWSTWVVLGLGVAAGIGLLVRPTGLIYLGMWAVLLLLERRTWRALLAFLLATAPFVAFWMFSNWVRTGSVVGLGLNNSMPGYDYHTPMVRFGSQCSDTRGHAWELTRRLFSTFFTVLNEDSSKDWPWLDKCHFKLEPRILPGQAGTIHNPEFGMAVLVALGWMLLHQLRRRESRVALYVPAAITALLFGTYVWAGAGFAWRYVIDFWPAIVLAGVQYVRFLPRTAQPLLGYPLALAFVAFNWAGYNHYIKGSATNNEVLDDPGKEAMWDQFTNWRWGQDKPLANRAKCGEKDHWILHDFQGWKDQCTVDTFSNVFLGVPYKSEDRYQLKFKTEGFTSRVLRVYVNGRIYPAFLTGDTYQADVSIRYSRLTSPIVMATIEWTREFEAPPGKMEWIELK